MKKNFMYLVRWEDTYHRIQNYVAISKPDFERAVNSVLDNPNYKLHLAIEYDESKASYFDWVKLYTEETKEVEVVITTTETKRVLKDITRGE